MAKVADPQQPVDDAPPCARCGVIKVIMMSMEPGLDGKPWRLCLTHWREFGGGEHKQEAPPSIGLPRRQAPTPQQNAAPKKSQRTRR